MNTATVTADPKPRRKATPKAAAPAPRTATTPAVPPPVEGAPPVPAMEPPPLWQVPVEAAPDLYAPMDPALNQPDFNTPFGPSWAAIGASIRAARTAPTAPDGAPPESEASTYPALRPMPPAHPYRLRLAAGFLVIVGLLGGGLTLAGRHSAGSRAAVVAQLAPPTAVVATGEATADPNYLWPTTLPVAAAAGGAAAAPAPPQALAAAPPPAPQPTQVAQLTIHADQVVLYSDAPTATPPPPARPVRVPVVLPPRPQVVDATVYAAPTAPDAPDFGPEALPTATAIRGITATPAPPSAVIDATVCLDPANPDAPDFGPAAPTCSEVR